MLANDSEVNLSMCTCTVLSLIFLPGKLYLVSETTESRLVTYWIQTEAHWSSAASQNCIQNSSNSNA